MKNYAIRKKIFLKRKKVKKISEKSSKIFRRSIFAIKDIKKNEYFNNKNIDCFRPNIGLGSENYFQILNKKSKIDIKKGQVLKKKYIQ